jgi:hypothetical protein
MNRTRSPWLRSLLLAFAAALAASPAAASPLLRAADGTAGAMPARARPPRLPQ